MVWNAYLQVCVRFGACESLLTARGWGRGGLVYYCCKWVARRVSKIALGRCSGYRLNGCWPCTLRECKNVLLC